MTIGISAIPALSRTMQGEEMLQPEEVAAMLRLHELGWGAKRLAKEFGGARATRCVGICAKAGLFRFASLCGGARLTG